MSLSLSIEHISKRYRLGTFGSGSAAEDIRRWWTHTVLRRPQAEPKVFQLDYGNRDGNDLWALRDVSFHVKEGEVIGIIGKNGSGKSTLLKVLSQITAPTSGRVRINGRLASLLEVGTGFHGELTGRENIFLNGSILGMSPAEIRRRFDEIVDFSEIEEFIDTPVKRYSSGMFVRLAFAVAAHLETEIMVIDEVLAVGDVGFQRKCLGKMSDASSAGRTVLFVSHRMDHITALCRRSVVLNAGRLIFDGATEQALSRYYKLFQDERPGDLSERLDRRGRGRGRIVDAWIEDVEGNRTETIITGQHVRFKLRIKNMENKALRNVTAGIGIFSLTNQFLTSVSTTEARIPAFDVGRDCLVTIDVPRLSLNQGQYYFNANLRSASGAFEFDDLIENVTTFSVDYGDFHGIGQASGGIFALPHSATVVENDAFVSR
ncbi:MAG TPA: ABC transporter ATP-binding protein [Stellaceae bacterium]|nr:ABC transporter ATP-binding protein [Stellaceae bacterium]